MGTAKFSGAHLWLRTSSLSDCFYRTVVGAGAAVDAGIGVDLVMLVAGGNRLNGTVAGAEAAGNAVVANLICHLVHLHLWSDFLHCNTDFGKSKSFLVCFFAFPVAIV